MIKIAHIHFILSVVLCFVSAIPTYAVAFGRDLPYRLVYAAYNLSSDTEAQNLHEMMSRAKAAGYNGIVLADYRLQLMDRSSEKYLKNVAAVKRTADQLHLKIFPIVSTVSQAQGLLIHDPNLAEGMPVRNTLFLVKKGQADLVTDPIIRLRGGDFEQSQGNKVAGWDIHDKVGQTTSVDRTVRHGGFQSLCLNITGKSDAKAGSDFISQIITVSPYRQYHLSAWIKTENLGTSDRVRHTILSSSGQPLSFTEWEVKRNQDWVQYHTVFNSQNHRRIRFDIGVFPGKEGKVWIDDVTLEEVGLLNVLRRNGCPLTVKSEDGYLYREGKDYDTIRDDKLTVNGKFSIYHRPPSIKIPPGSKIREGQILKVSYYHAVAFGKGMQVACLSDEKVHNLLKKDIEDIEQQLHPAGIFLNYSDIRIANWCESCRARNLSPGHLLAQHVARTIQIVHAVNPQMKVLVWSDMFDPYHNATDHYYLVNGPLADSWQGLSPETIVVNWNQPQKMADSLKWFADRMHSQIVAVCFDNGPRIARKRLEGMIKNYPQLTGILYMTNNHHYEDLESFALQVWGQR